MGPPTIAPKFLEQMDLLVHRILRSIKQERSAIANLGAVDQVIIVLVNHHTQEAQRLHLSPRTLGARRQRLFHCLHRHC